MNQPPSGRKMTINKFPNLHAYSTEGWSPQFIGEILNNAIKQGLSQGLSQGLENGCPKLAIINFFGNNFFEGDHNVY